jgi:CHASE3 domain sensor protein
MKSRSARLALLVLFLLALAVTAYLFRKSESAQRVEMAAGQTFSEHARKATLRALEVRAAQQAYVATGQGEDFWTARVSGTLASLRESLTTLRATAVSPEAQAGIDAASGALQDFAQMDGRARDYVRTGQKLLAADMIFSNGSELTDTAVTALEKATAAELAARNAAADTFNRRESFALVAGWAAACLVILLLLPRVEGDLAAPSFVGRSEPVPARAGAGSAGARGPNVSELEGWSAPRRLSTGTQTAPVTAAAAESPAASDIPPAAADVTPDHAPALPMMGPAAPAAPAVPSVDLAAVASLCSALSQVDDTMALPPLLEQAAVVLDAAGIILWIADPDGRELSAVLAQGYPQNLINRLGTIPRNAENATAAAYRTGLLQVVYADGASNGAIVAPLVTCGGCVGVMAAEVRGDSEKQDAKLAAATILAAQLASLVGPPAVRSESAEVANA